MENVLCKCIPEWLLNMAPPNCAGCHDRVLIGMRSFSHKMAWPCVKPERIHMFDFLCHSTNCIHQFHDYLFKTGRHKLLEDIEDHDIDTNLLSKILLNHTLTGRKCAYCGTAEQTHCKFGNCSGCMNTKYCNKECQNKHWKQHKKVCTPIYP